MLIHCVAYQDSIAAEPGIWGMNFETMPKLKWPRGVCAVWACFGTIPKDT